MNTEIEAKFLDINPVEFRKRLERAGANLIFPERFMRRKNFDFSDKRLEKIGGWVRVRDEGEKITLAYKQLVSRTAEGMKEIETEVKSFDDACNILLAIGMKVKSYQETKREAWEYNGIEIAIDTWPWVPTFAEFEGPSEESITKAAVDLGLNWKTALHGSVEPIYQIHYAVTQDEINSWQEITFVPVPEWLKAKRK